MEKLGINTIQLIAQGVNVVILVVILNKFLYKPVLSLLEKRKEQAREQEEKGKQLETRLASMEKKEKELLRQAKLKADAIVKQAEANAKKATASALEEAKERATKEKVRLMKDAELEVQRMKDDMQKLVAKQAVVLANEALATLVGHDIHSKLTESQVAKLAKK